MRKILSTSLVAAVLAAAAGTAGAVTATTTFGVTATVLKTCSAAASTLGFGTYTPGVAALTGSTAVNVKCTKSTPFTVALNGGNTTGGTITQRLMTNGTDNLQYNLYTTAALSTLFGDGTTGATMGGTGAGLATAVAINVYGSLPDNAANQAVSPGSYSDTINVTVSY